MFQVNFQRTGASDKIGIRKLKGLKWSAKKKSRIYFNSAPIIIDSVLYFLNAVGYLEALDRQNGQKLWEVFLGSDLPSQMAFYENTIYISGEDGYIIAVDIQAKCQKWSSKTGNSHNLSPAIVDDVICINDKSGCLYGLNRETGQSLWIFQPAKDMKMTPAAAMQGVVYVGSYNGYLYAVHAKTGEIKWQVEVGALDADIVPVIFENVIYIAAKKRIIHAVDADSGQIIKEIKVDGNDSGKILSLSIVNGVIYIQDAVGYFCAINIQSGRELWRVHSRQYSFINHFVVNGTELYSGSTGAVHALDLKTGEKLWKFIAPDFIEMWLLKPSLWWMVIVSFISKRIIGISIMQMFSYPVISDGVIYVVCNNEYLYALH